MDAPPTRSIIGAFFSSFLTCFQPSNEEEDIPNMEDIPDPMDEEPVPGCCGCFGGGEEEIPDMATYPDPEERAGGCCGCLGWN
ncbi:hypothetical protein AALP_AAs45060U000300 [Arabis alpina]|uniref:Uncharacterized protein n=1 Tax=Arabis alpina TaxID=50452 RepID=A0A087FYC8_ARAAL|nr:hypothetical protein AALP_AAs45060U000300 [Arabis alpina]